MFSVLVLFQAPAKAFGPEENALIQKIFDFRLRLRTLDTEDECIEKIIEYRNSLSDEMKTFSEEAQITCTNMLSTAQYNCEYAKDMKSPNMEKILRPQYEKIIQFTRADKAADPNPWFILTSADILNSMMQFLPQSDFFISALKYAKSDYDKFYGNINLAQFYFEEKNTAECEKLMEEAEKILSGTRYVQFLKSINAIGYSLFDYNMNSRRDKINQKLVNR